MWSPEFFVSWQGIACTKHGGSVHSLGIWQLLSRPAYASGCIYLCCDCHCRWHICEGPCIESCGGQNVGSYNISEVLGNKYVSGTYRKLQGLRVQGLVQ